MLAGLEEITDGEILIGDRVVNDLTPKERDIAMVFQNYALYPHMTVEDNLAFGLSSASCRRHEITERVQRAAETLEIDDFLKRKPRALSGGQRQRVAMGRAIVREPQAFLMDEPLSNLDAKLRVQMRGEIHDLQRRLGVTTIYVTHDQVEAMTLGDRVAVMLNGRLQQVATPQALYERRSTSSSRDSSARRRSTWSRRSSTRSDGGLTVSFGDHRLTVDDSSRAPSGARAATSAGPSCSGSGRRTSRTSSSSPTRRRTAGSATVCDLTRAARRRGARLLHGRAPRSSSRSRPSAEVDAGPLGSAGAGREGGRRPPRRGRVEPAHADRRGKPRSSSRSTPSRLYFFDPETRAAI